MDTWEITPDQVTLTGLDWDAILADVRDELGLPARARLRAEPHALLVYGKGQFFLPHQDSEKGGHDDPRGRNCLVLTSWTAHLQKLANALRDIGHDPVVLRGGMGARSRAAALARLQPRPGEPPLLVAATGPYAGEGFDCPALDTLFLAAPISYKGRLVQYVGRILRPYDGKITAEVHDYHDELTGVLAAALTRRAPGYTSLGFPDPRRLVRTPSAKSLAIRLPDEPAFVALTS